MNGNEIKQINEIVKCVQSKDIHILLLEETAHDTNRDKLLSALIKEGRLRCLYVALTKGHGVIARRFKNEASRIYFINGIDKAQCKVCEGNNCVCLSNPESLTELSLAITTAINTSKFDFMLFDSLSTLLIYNDVKMIQKFSHYLFTKIRNSELGGLFFSLNKDKESEMLVHSIASLCDGCIELGE